jgi:benzoate membrane transport protein
VVPQPVLTAWSTPGAALLVTAGAGVPMAEGMGAFVVCALLITLAGATGLVRAGDGPHPAGAGRGPAGRRAGALRLRRLWRCAARRCWWADAAAYLLGRRWWPRYAVPGVLLAACGGGAAGQLHLGGVQWQLATPVFTMPQFSAAALVGVALPLFVVTMASQNLPGVAAQRAAGYARRCRR